MFISTHLFPGAILPIIYCTGMLLPKGVPFWAPRMGKGSLYPEKGYHLGANFRNLICERVAIFPQFSI